MINAEPFYKSKLTSWFYFPKILPIAIAIPLLLLARNDIAILMAILFFAFLLTLNKSHFVITVYEDRFIISKPSLYGNRFAEIDTYYFDEISDIEYFPKETNVKTVMMGLIASELLKSGFKTFSQPPVLRFNHTASGEKDPQNITYTFSQNNDSLIKGLEMIIEKKKTYRR